MRFVVMGAGAVGGVVGGRLAQAGHDVVLIARGEHGRRIAGEGLVLRSPVATDVVRVPVAPHPAAVDFRPDDVVLLAVKSQDTGRALADLHAEAPPGVSIVCLQNGVANEPEALRRFAAVYAVPVMCPTLHLRPGVVDASSAPVTGILDIGRYPAGSDPMAEAVAAAFRSATFSSEARADIMRWKWAKLLLNLGNAVEAACGPAARLGDLAALADAEGRACLAAAGVDVATREEERERRGDLLTMARIDGERRPGGSTWQSLSRGAGSVEVDHLNGEIVLLGRLHGVPTPVNEVLQRLLHEMARSGAPPESLTEQEVLGRLPGR